MTPIRTALTVRDPRLSSAARLLQLVLVGNARRGRVRMLQRDLLGLTNLDPRTARKGIALLLDLGYLDPGRRIGVTPEYVVVFPPPAAAPQ